MEALHASSHKQVLRFAEDDKPPFGCAHDLGPIFVTIADSDCRNCHSRSA